MQPFFLALGQNSITSKKCQIFIRKVEFVADFNKIDPSSHATIRTVQKKVSVPGPSLSALPILPIDIIGYNLLISLIRK
jgi:hypothetical protein